MAASSVADIEDPKFIKYLLDPTAGYDCYIVVGNASIAPVERIGVVTKMLFAHSAVMRTDLQAKNIEEKVPYEIVDILPNTFKNLLRFVYGHDTSSSLCFDDADNLLYAAEKYMISDLKDNLARRLMSLLNSTNICSLMNNPACYQALELNSAINKILQNETKKVFASPHFLELTSDAFVKILEQDALNVKEIEVWRSALQWAKHKANSEDGTKCRSELVKPMKHIRLCTFSAEDFCREVLSTNVLSKDEAFTVGISIGSQQIQPELTEICQLVEVRKLSCVKSAVNSKVMTMGSHTTYTNDCTFRLETMESELEICSLMLCSSLYGSNNRREFVFKVDVEQEDVPETKSSVVFTTSNLCGDVTIPISTEKQEMLLQRNSQYKINISCNQTFNVFSSSSLPVNTHLSIKYSGNTNYCIKRIDYKTFVPPE